MIKQYLNILPTLIMMAALAASLSTFAGQIKAAGAANAHVPQTSTAVQAPGAADKPPVPH
jgi:hypothetical protein